MGARSKRQRLYNSILLINFTLMSSLYLTALTVSFLPGLTKEQYDNLPIYCKASTGYFECKNYTIATTYCLPQSLKCRVRCSNNDELQCPGYGANTCPKPDSQFQCTNSSTVAGSCIEDFLVCDGRPHCHDAADESLELCKQRRCTGTQFACEKSPGHCLPASMRCDGNFDCMAVGLADYSDELNCPDVSDSQACRPNEFRCPSDPHTGQHGTCLPQAFVCDHFKDCRDGSDELDCQADTCDTEAGEFVCDGRCLKASLRCDGTPDCTNGIDEVGCKAGKCQFQSEFHCKFSPTGACVPFIFVCDGSKDCQNGEDEVCVIDNTANCNSDSYWTCKSGKHCIRLENRCDDLLHCPDGSDEHGCPTRTPTTPPMSMAQTSIATPNEFKQPRVLDECRDVFGACDQICVSAAATSPTSSFSCSCLPGYRLAQSDLAAGGRKGVCRAVGAAKLMLATETGIHTVDSETGKMEKLSVSGIDLIVPKFLELDTFQKLIYFHTRDGLVGYLRLDDPSSQAVILMQDAELDSLAYDWTRRLLFFTVPESADRSPAKSGYVGVMDAHTGRWAVLKYLSCPRGLALQPELGLLYISLWCGPRPGVYSMRMDGSELKPLVTERVGAPGHLALDIGQTIENQRLYWLDTKLRGIYTCRVSDGKDLRAVWHMGQGYSGLPLGLSVFEDRVLWSDLRYKAVFAIDKFTGTPLRLVTPGPGNETVLSAVVYHSVRQPGEAGARACSCSGHICITQSDPAYTAACLCDQQHAMVGGACILDSSAAAARLSTSPGVPAEAAAISEDGRGASNRGAVIAACVSVALLMALLVGGFVAFACLRRSGKLSRAALLTAFNGGSSGSNSASGSESSSESHLGPAGTAVGSAASGIRSSAGRAGMTKVNSRTPLTECEIGMDEQNTC